MEHYSNYSIFGSNTDTQYLLKLQNNESNIKIDIHNRDHNFTIDYVSSNEIITEYNTLGLKDITRIDENNYIHKSISNSSSNIIQGKYGNQNDINGIYFPTVANFPISVELAFAKYSENYFDSNVLRVASEYNEYIATNTYNRLTSFNPSTRVSWSPPLSLMINGVSRLANRFAIVSFLFEPPCTIFKRSAPAAEVAATSSDIF